LNHRGNVLYIKKYFVYTAVMLTIQRLSTRIAMATVLVVVGAMAADLSGKWKGSFSSSEPEDPARANPLFVVLKQEGNRLTGTAGLAESQQMPIKAGKAEGDHLVFEVDIGGGTIAFDLKSAGAELQGEMWLSEGGRKTAARVILKRAD
jgi:hypothetical protein